MSQVYLSIYLFIYLNLFILFILFLAALGLRCCSWAFSSCSEWGLLFIEVHRLLIAVASLVVEHGLQVRGLQQLQHAGSAVVAHGLSCTTACRSSCTRDRTRVSCTGRQILNHCATREVPLHLFRCSLILSVIFYSFHCRSFTHLLLNLF